MPKLSTGPTRAAMLALVGLLGTHLNPGPVAAQQAPQLARDSIPSRIYFQAIEELYRGEYRDAERVFKREVRGGVKIGVTGRWIDTICYRAMLGEVYYHQGHPALALEQFDQACEMFLQYPNWLLRVEFKPLQADTNRLNRPPPWGNGSRKFTLGRFPRQMLIRQGDLFSAKRAVQQGGGVISQLQFWQVNVVEVVRATALAIRRRNELLGPLAAYDALSKELITALSHGGAPPNHWSNAWVDLQLGLAYADPKLALPRLQRAERVAGKYDHPLTCVALLEMGRLNLQVGHLDAAQQLFEDAIASAFYYDDTGVIDEAFRLHSICRMAANREGVSAALDTAIAWARRNRYDHVVARLCFALADESMAAGHWEAAATALKAGQARLKDADAGLLGNRSRFLQGRLLQADGHASARETLLTAIAQHVGMSTHNNQLVLANARFDQRQLSTRSALKVYQELLGDPKPVEQVLAPLETLARLKTPHQDAFDRWFAAVSPKDIGRALEISDLAKRHRYLQRLPWGGRLAALRGALEAPDELLTQHARGQRNELLLRFPEYAEARKLSRNWEAELRARWKAVPDARAERDLAKVWRRWEASVNDRESMLGAMSTVRVPADIQFPPIKATADWQAQLKPGQAVMVFHDTPAGLHGFLLTRKSATRWNCGPSGRLVGPLQAFLRGLGNYDANHELSADELTSQDWLTSGSRLAQALLKDSSIDPKSMTDLLIIPDGLGWYVPWAALPSLGETTLIPLISTTRIRFAPTVGLAFAPHASLRRVQRSGLAGHSILPGKTDAQREESLVRLRACLENPLDLIRSLPVPNSISGALLETLVVLDETELNLDEPLVWSPIPEGRSARQTSLGDWLRLPQFGPQRVIFPATHTIAERGGKGSKRRGAAAPMGTELFLASCGLMASGAQTILLSNWRVGGRSTVEIVREFLQELPHMTAADAWQRSVQLAREMPVEAATERRVKAGKNDALITASHPIFWAGYLLLDISEPVPVAGEAGEQNPPIARLGKMAASGRSN
ncbi:MAG: CHAT domain-containing protein [Pirellulales bacterium]|nr:CHAT domain-containing protein [Pirellulales bacterium]